MNSLRITGEIGFEYKRKIEKILINGVVKWIEGNI